jgi:hypothetical protein
MEPKGSGHFAFRLCVVVTQIAIALHKMEFIQMIVNEGSVSISDRTLYLDSKDSPYKDQPLLLFREIIAINYENRKERKYILWSKGGLYVCEARGVSSKHCV